MASNPIRPRAKKKQA